MTEIKTGKEAIKLERTFLHRIALNPQREMNETQKWHYLYSFTLDDYNRFLWFVALISGLVIAGRLIF